MRRAFSLRTTARPLTRCLSTTTARPFATPTARPPPPNSTAPVDDIDLVFDYPSEGQGSYQKQPLETSGLDLHSAMPHHPKAGMKGAGKMEKEMEEMAGGHMYRYIGLGALGLGGLYMMMRRQSAAPPPHAPEQGELVGAKSADKNMERMLGRGR